MKDKMEWYDIAKTKKVKRFAVAPEFSGKGFMNRLIYGLLFIGVYMWIFPVVEYQYGLKQINDKGETRVIWEKD